MKLSIGIRNTIGMKHVVFSMLVFAVGLLVSTDAFAITTPTAGSFAYDVFDIAVNKILQGPIGFVCGMMAIVFGAVMAVKSEIMAAIPAVIGGAILLKADAVVNSLGMVF